MPTFKVVYPDGSVAKNTKVNVSFDGGGMKSGITDTRGYVTISGSSTHGKIYVRGREVHHGSLNIGEVTA
ncbi:hypothetical protein [Candidatus Thiosymbion oneisti]|uniref:hypothetical protein n=1 Tax=Candidatus Thiosymbion oneisti TaxID=589554 RepID=UPI00105C013A|nr:hypothetical protein [Candidatus Thiosymbion oneisti]